MKNPSLLLLPGIFFVFLNIGCDQEPKFIDLGSTGMLIENRSPDPECELCSEILIPHCCCIVENREEFPLEIHICGVIGNYGIYGETCSMYTPAGGSCTNVNNMGVSKTLGYMEKLYFCIATNASFSIHNANGASDGRIRVGCSGSYMPGGNIGLNLSYSDGSFTRYFETVSCSVQVPCPY